MEKKIRVGIFVSHPVQYHVPLWRILASYPEFDVKVHYFSDHSIRGEIDPGFGVPVSWDTPMLEGYEYEFIRRGEDMSNPRTYIMPDAWKRLRDGAFDWVVIAGYTYAFELQILQLAPMLGIKVLMRGEFTDLKRQPPPLWKKAARTVFLRWAYSRVSAFGYVGEEAKEHLLRNGIPKDRMFFSPYSVDSTEFIKQRQSFDRETSRKELGIEDDMFVLLFSGKLIPRKEILTLVRAFRHIPKDKKVALLVLGDGEQREEVLREGRELLGDRLLFQGFVNQTQMGRYFVAADGFVLPSNYEAWGLVVNEAMLFGLPLLLSHIIGSAKDLLIPGETGYLFRAEDERDLARAILKLIEDPQKAKAMGERALQLVEGYSIEVSAQGLREAILACS
ncbi:MAG: glycosyltransferase family 4 protein [Myxococcales bacterium]|nr:glycosyltransferase family 4 protein [Myxococcales bacterium]MCB9642899.1 glycosyltransferase family 4 protein [Myxococcales bacterium]